MDRLWAPWRAQYIRENAENAEKADGDRGRPAAPACFLCHGLNAPEADDKANLLVWRGSSSAIFLNKFPYNNGHLLVCPSQHCGNLADLSATSLHEPLSILRVAVRALDRMMRPDGYNVGLNLGKSAGAGLPGHLHWHVVPRWDGDTNFMPVLGDAKVIIESLDEFYDRFRDDLRREFGMQAS